MVCGCTHIQPHYSFFEALVDAPSKCYRFLEEKIGSKESVSPSPINKKVIPLKPEKIIADIAKAIKSNIAPGDLDKKLKDLADAALASGNSKGIPSCLDFLSQEQLHNAAGSTVEATALKIDILHSPYNSGNPHSIKIKILNFFGHSLNFIPNLLNTLLSAFRLFDTGKDPQTFWEISAALDILYKFVMIPAAIIFVIHLLIPGLGIAAYAITAVIVTALIAAITIYVKWLKPCPKQLAKCDNLIWKASTGNLPTVVGRNKEVDQIIATLISNKKCKHPTLVGKSGVGKNEVVSALAQRIASGNVPDSLKGKELFQISSALLDDVNGFSDPIATLLQRLQGHEDQVIFFFDEIHVAFQNNALRNYMKEFVDKFHCIGATTPDEYEKIKADVTFGGRLQEVAIEPMEELQVREVLYQLAKNLPIPLHIKEEVYQEIVETPAGDDDRSQPARAKALFLKTIGDKMVELSETFVPQKLATAQADYCALRSAYLNCLSGERGALEKQLADLKKEIDQDKKELKERKIATTEYKKILSHYIHHRDAQVTLANNILSLQKQKKTQEADSQTKKFLFEQHYFLPQIESKLKELEESIQTRFAFDPSVSKI